MGRLSNRWLSGAVVVFALSAFCSLTLAAEFSADMNVTEGDNTTTNKFYVKDTKYRIETMEEGQEIIIIVDQGANLTRVLNVNENSYLEMPCDDMRSLANDPFQSLKATLETPDIEKKAVGPETVNGLECDKSVLLWGGSEFYTYFMSRKYDFPIKIILGESVKVVELTNIKETVIDDGLFELPDGFTAMKESQPVTETKSEKTTPGFPEWVSNVTSAEFVTLPFEQAMSSGDMVRIKVKEGKGIWVMGTNNHGGESTFLTVPFLNGQPIDDPSVVFAEYGQSRMYEMMMEGQSWPVTLSETPGEADEVVIRVDQGEVKIKAEYTAK